MRRIALLLSIIAALPAAAQQIDYTCRNRCTQAGYSYAFCNDKCSYGTSQRSGIDPLIAQPGNGIPGGTAVLEALQRGRENKRQEEQLRIQREQLEIQRQQMELQRRQMQTASQPTQTQQIDFACKAQCLLTGLSDSYCDDKCSPLYDRLMKLDELRRRGLLTDAEFEQQKQRVLNED